MLILHAVPVSLYSAKLRLVLRAKGLAWDERPPDGGYGSAEWLARIPSGNLPVPVHDRLTIADSEAAAEYLEEVFPDPPLLPADPALRAHMRMRGRFHDTRLEPELRRLFAHIRPARCACAAGGISRRSTPCAAIFTATGRGCTPPRPKWPSP